MFDAIDISTSGLVAQRVRSNVAAMNIAMADVVDTPQGGPYRRRSVLFGEGSDPQQRGSAGVHVREIRREDVFRWEYDPNHPYANADGYVKLPGIDPLVEMVNLMEASRAYEANITAIEVSKAMLNSSLRLLA
ncbi:MAG: flagellar basal body rod protein FlgC [Sedimentisphaerales bacterium]|nr:flagellar basal body rod protein FlgC [Sedimentisphaerales bacterium]